MRCESCGSEVEMREIPFVNSRGKPTGGIITGQVVGPFLIHAALAGSSRYVVTHISSGGVVTERAQTKLAALDIAAILAEHPENWDFVTFEEAFSRRDHLFVIVREAKTKILGSEISR